MISLFILFLFGAMSTVTSYDSCSSRLGDRCIQKCNTTSCQCGGRHGKHVYLGCTQMCGLYPCNTITCSSATCIQSCHGCTMECTGDVGFCVQRCLSGQCMLKCSAERCEQDCSHGDCKQTTTTNTTSLIPRQYLLLLASCFAATTILSIIALCLSCRAMRQRRMNNYRRLRAIPDSPPTHRCHAVRHGQMYDDINHNQPISILPLPEKPV